MIKHLYEKYKDIIPYAFFGLCTTIVNIIVYWICAHLMELPVLPSTIIAWFVSVMFAYLTNRKWVFHSEANSRNEIQIEVISFYACRIATGIIDWLFMYIFVDLMHLNDLVIKVVSNILVIILNYVVSKLVIFRKKR